MANGQSTEPILIVLRGNSGSGKSTTADELRRRYGRGVAIVSQDLIRRIVLKERDIPNGANIGLIDLTARHALAHGFHAIVEGILSAERYGEMLQRLHRDYADRAHFYYFDVSFEESLRRHVTKPNAHEFGEREMREWFRPRDLLPNLAETIIPESRSLDETVSLILAETRILDHGSRPAS
jgi:predicted kinase